MTEDEMVGWYHQLNGYGFEQAPGVGNGQGSLASPGSAVPGILQARTLEWAAISFSNA